MRFSLSSFFVVALLSSDFIAVDAKLRGANKEVILRKLSDSVDDSTSTDVSADSPDDPSSDEGPSARKLSSESVDSDESVDSEDSVSEDSPDV